MSTDALERQMDEVARCIRICSDHQRSTVQILRGGVSVAAQIRESALPEPGMVLVDRAPAVEPGAPDLGDETWIPTGEVDSTLPTVFDPFQVFFAPATETPAGPFDDLLAALTTPKARRPVRVGPPPPRSRFMMRVAAVDRPHRVTKRDYDYFEELNAALAALAIPTPTDRG
jgi:hypothetical protein